MTDQKTKKYWNEDYFKYWKKTTEDINRKDVPKENIVYSYLEKMNLNQHEVILDIGCGFGRNFNYFLNKDIQIYGIDVSEAMISHAKKIWGDKVDLCVSDAEKIDFPNEMFDRVICWAVFDSCLDQFAVLSEISRVLRVGGEVLITGKHKPYWGDDQEASIAEINAEKKNHPNVFTNHNNLMDWIDQTKFKIIFERYFEYRGDFAKNLGVSINPDNYYEFVLILKKGK